MVAGVADGVSALGDRLEAKLVCGFVEQMLEVNHVLQIFHIDPPVIYECINIL